MKHYITIALLLIAVSVRTQNVTITPSGVTPEQGGVERITTNVRMSTSYKNAQKAGKMVFDLNNGQLYVWEGSKWKRILTEPSEPIFTSVPFVERFDGDDLENDGFGFSVAISGSWAIVGSPQHRDKGEAYIFKLTENSWQLQKRLCLDFVYSQVSNGAEFGYDVDIDVIGNEVVAVVGAPEQAGGTGKAYIFRYKSVSGSYNWFYEPASGTNTPLSHPTPTNNGAGAAHDRFGHSVAIEENYIAIGAPYDYIIQGSTVYNTAGSVTIFKATLSGGVYTWAAMGNSPNGTIWADDLSSNAYFGWDVDISKNTYDVGVRSTETEYVVLIGAPRYQSFSLPPNPTDYKGRADLYKLTTVLNTPVWSRLRSFTLAALQNNYTFQYGFSEGLTGNDYQIGTKVVISENTLAFGAPLRNDKGTVVVFRTMGSWFSTTYGPTQGILFRQNNTGKYISLSGKSVIIPAFNPARIADNPDRISIYSLISESNTSSLLRINELSSIEIENDYKTFDIHGDSSGNFILGKQRIVVLNATDKSSIYLGNVNSN